MNAVNAAGDVSSVTTTSGISWKVPGRVGDSPIIGAGTCALLNILFARNWPADIGLAPYGEDKVQPPVSASAGNAVSLSFEVLREAVRRDVALALLPAPSRAVLLLHDLEGFTHEEQEAREVPRASEFGEEVHAERGEQRRDTEARHPLGHRPHRR